MPDLSCQVSQSESPVQSVCLWCVLRVSHNHAPAASHISKTCSHGVFISIPDCDVTASLFPESVGLQKKSNKTQYLYRQLCRIHQELSLLGPSDFSSASSYSQALQQVQHMKDLLEEQVFDPVLSNQDGRAQKKYAA